MTAEVSIELSDGYVVEHYEGDEDGIVALLIERGLPAPALGAITPVAPAAAPACANTDAAAA